MTAPQLIRRAAAGALLVCGLAGCATTSKVMLAPARAAIPVEEVRVYQAPPERFIELARIEAASGVGFGTPGQTDSALLKLRREAAAIGANGVLLEGIDTVGSPVSLGVGGGRYGSRGGVSGGIGIPTAQRRAVGTAIWVDPASVEAATAPQPPATTPTP